MKLFTRIYLQVLAGCLLLSLVPFFYLLNESQKRNLEDVNLYEQTMLQKSTAEFERKFLTQNGNSTAGELQKPAAAYVFRQIFKSSAALYWEGQELYNNTPYEFDYSAIRGRAERSAEGIPLGREQNGQRESGSSDYVIQEVNGEKLMLLAQTGDFGGSMQRQYLIVSFKNVTDVFARTRNLFLRGIVFISVLLLLIGLGLFRGIYRTIRPLVRLQEASAAIAEGDYAIRVPVESRDEIGELAIRFNQMAGKIEEHVEKLSETNEAQLQLIGSLAHELKTPMTALIGYSDTLLTIRLSENRRTQALSYIGSECRRLARLSEKMLELTGLYENGAEISMKDQNVEELLNRLKELTRYRLSEKNLVLDTTCTPPGLKRRMDSDLMMSLLMNLVDNACKASDMGGVICVRAERDRFVVEDHGMGIPQAELGRVTEAFYMVDKSRSKSKGSVGLGLAFCQKIAALHGARLSIESEVGKGTRVTVIWE